MQAHGDISRGMLAGAELLASIAVFMENMKPIADVAMVDDNHTDSHNRVSRMADPNPL
jgi:hypothetical protein